MHLPVQSSSDAFKRWAGVHKRVSRKSSRLKGYTDMAVTTDIVGFGRPKGLQDTIDLITSPF